MKKKITICITKSKKSYLEKCPECGQTVTLDFWIKKMKKNGFPNLAKILKQSK